MGQLLAGLDVGEDIQEDGDFLGGFNALETNLYDFIVETAYVAVSDGGAKALNVNMKTADGKQLNAQFWMSSGTAKGCLSYYVNKKTNEKKYLPGFVQANHLCLLAAGKKITAMETEEKVINIFSFQEKKDLPTKVDMVVGLLGKEITAGVIQQIVDKNKDTGQTDAAGKKIYAPTGETRTENEVDKFFRTRDGMTVAEIVAKSTESVFKDQWVAKWEGQVKDKTSKDNTNGLLGAPAGGKKGATPAVDELFA